MLKILSWNIRQGGGSRILKICQALIRSQAQILILSEYRNNKSGEQIAKKLHKAGYTYHTISESLGNANSVAIFSKIEGKTVVFTDIDPNYSTNVVAMAYEAFTVYGVYLPHKKKHVLFDFLSQAITENPAAIIAGDFNTGKNYIDQKGDSFWYTEALETLESQGAQDAFRMFYPDQKEYSWYSHQGNGYRYDHSYVTEAILPIVKDCYYLHDWREEKLSDHSPMVLELG